MEQEYLQLPHTVGGENAVIASMLINSSVVAQVMTELEPVDFYIRTNRDAYDAVFKLFSQGEPRIDMITVRNQMLYTGRYQEHEILQYMENITRENVSSTGINSYIKMVKEKSMLRKIAGVSSDVTQLISRGTEDGTELLALAEQRILDLRQQRTNQDMVDVSEMLQQMYEHLIEKSQRGADISGLSTGLVDLDKALSGLNKSDLILLAARPGMGKTSMALNVLLSVAKISKKTVAFFSLEMSMVQLALRLIATESYVDNKRLTSGQLRPEDWEKIQAACNALLETKILVNDNPFSTVADIKAKCRGKDDLGLIVIDYLQLMDSDGSGKSNGGNRQQTVSDISRALKIMAKELEVPVICLSQLSRASEKRESKRPVMSDLRDSGAIEQDADIILFLYREDYYDSETEAQDEAECIIAKNRHGETGTVKLQWLAQFTTFCNAPSQDTPPPY